MMTISHPRRDRQATSTSVGLRWLVAGTFALVMLLSVCAPRLVVGGVPVRSLLAFFNILLAVLVKPKALSEAIQDFRLQIIIICLIMLLGILSSLLNAVDGAIIFQQVMEIHFQAIVNLLLAGCVIQVCGKKAGLKAVVFAIGLSAGFAILQAAGINAAWATRAVLGRIQHDDVLTAMTYMRHIRATGLSLTPVHLATQVTLALACYGLYRLDYTQKQLGARRFDSRIVVAAIIALMICVASGNRSPIVGIMLFLLAYCCWATPRLTIVLIPLALVSIPVISIAIDSLQESGLRAFQIGDGSSSGRLPLIKLGLLEFLARPYGYGLAFDSTEHWRDYWTEVQDMSHAGAVLQWPLHNYFLIILNKYGALILLYIPWLIGAARRAPAKFMMFIPYILHILFHNDGPMLADFLIWFIVPFAVTAGREGQRRSIAPRRAMLPMRPRPSSGWPETTARHARE